MVVLVDSAVGNVQVMESTIYPCHAAWVRGMFIDDVAGYMVTYSKRKHVEKNLSQCR